MPGITLDEAVAVFTRGFSFTRSFTFPYLAERLHEHVWVLRDALRTRGDYRIEEYVGHDISPETLDAIARYHTRGRYRICVIRDMATNDAPIRAGFKALGYRLMTTEAFMVRGMEHIVGVREPLPVLRISTSEEAEMLRKATRTRHILPEHLQQEPAPIRQYAAMDGEKPVGWVGSVAAGEYCWCASMYVAADYRRRGIARSLMTRMLQEDRAAGYKANVLLASHAGAKLYPTVGYEPIGELLAFTPPRDAEQAI